jgi:phosphohistidine phosphatase
MNKKLLLLRHAKSSWDDPNLSDYDRPLNNRGKQNASSMGNFLKKENLVPDLIISSPAIRANKTADIIAKKSGYDKKILESKVLYAATIDDYTDVIQNIKNEYNLVLLIGHNPTIEDVVERIVAERYVMKTCSLAYIDLAIDSWNKFDYDIESKLIEFIHAREL